MKLKLIFLLVAVFLWRGTGFCAGDITGNPTLGKTSGWRSLIEQPAEDDYSITGTGSALYNAGVFPVTFTGKTSNTLTGLSFVPFIIGDHVYEDDGSVGTVTGVDYTAKTITMSAGDAALFDTSGSLAPFSVANGLVDMGAKEYVSTPANNAPVVSSVTVVEAVSGDLTVEDEGDIECDATVSDDNDPNASLIHCWDIGDNGTCDATTEDPTSVSLAGLGYAPGQYVTVAYTATDTQGRVSNKLTATIQVTPAGEDPVEATKVFGRNVGNDFNTGDDTRIEQANPSTNNDTDNYLTTKIATGENWYTLLSWSLAALPNDAVATSAKIRMIKYLGPANGTQTVTAKVTTDPFVTSEATYTQYADGHNWSADFGRTTTLGSVTVAYNDARGTIHEINFGEENLTELNAAIASDGTFRCFLSMGAGYYNFYSNDSTAGEYGPELHVTYETEQEPEVEPTWDVYLVSPAPGSIATTDDEIILRLHFDQNVQFDQVGDLDLKVIGETGEVADIEFSITSTDLLIATDHYLVGTVAAGMATSNLTIKATISRSDDTIKYGAAYDTDITYAGLAEKALGIAVDTSAPDISAENMYFHCDNEGTLIEADTTYYTGDQFCNCVKSSDEDDLYFLDGPPNNVKIGLSKEVSGGSNVLPFYDGAGSSTLIFCDTVAEGDFDADLTAAGTEEDVGFIHGGTAVINFSLTEVSDYSLNAVDPAGGNIMLVGNKESGTLTGSLNWGAVDGTAAVPLIWDTKVIGDLELGDYWKVTKEVSGTLTVHDNCVVTLEEE